MKNPNRINGNQEATPTSLDRLYKSVIGEKVHSKEYSDLMDPIIKKIDEEHVEYINNSILLWNDYVGGSEAFVELLTNMIGLGEHGLIPYFGKNKTAAGKYSHAEKAVRFFFHDDSANKNPSYQSAKKIVELGRIIAHEMWHGYQYNEIEKHGPRASIYQDNFENYHEVGDGSFQDYRAYLEQPVETEAMVFGDKFAFKFVEKLISSLEKEQNEFRGKKAIRATSNNDRAEDDYEIYIGGTLFTSDEDMKMAELAELRRIYSGLERYMGNKAK